MGMDKVIRRGTEQEGGLPKNDGIDILHNYMRTE
jgi:hypothetical protein